MKLSNCTEKEVFVVKVNFLVQNATKRIKKNLDSEHKNIV